MNGMNALTCESLFWGTGKPCHHKAKYLAPSSTQVVCGIHARGFLRCIPLTEIEPGDFDTEGPA
jgi:hypothetical protein